MEESPEKTLIIAILTQAVEDLKLDKKIKEEQKTMKKLDPLLKNYNKLLVQHKDRIQTLKKAKQDALRWIRSEDGSPFSFEWMCGLAGFHPDWMRKNLALYLEENYQKMSAGEYSVDGGFEREEN